MLKDGFVSHKNNYHTTIKVTTVDASDCPEKI